MAEFNPFRTPGLRPEDESAFSPGGQFAVGNAEMRWFRRWLSRHGWFRRLCFWGTVVVAAGLVGLAIAHGLGAL